MKTIAVTGATGFVGKNLTRVLLKAGYGVVAFGRKALPNCIYWDITNGPFEKAPPVDTVVHCAAHVDDWAPYSAAHKGNTVGTENVLKTFPNVERFIFISSASVYDPFTSSSTLMENSACGNFLNAYSKTKWEAEVLVSAAEMQKRIILRPHIIYGPGDTAVLPRLLKARRFGRFLVVGDGQNRISVTHIENLCAAIVRAIEADTPDGCEVFNIADEIQDSVDVLINELRQALGINEPILHIPRLPAYAFGALEEAAYRLIGSAHPPLITRYAVAQMAYGHALDISKAQKILHYKPMWNYQRGFAEMKL